MDITIRQKGCIQFILGALVFSLFFYYITANGLNQTSGSRGNMGYLIGLALPGAFALAGLLQIITGKRFSELESWWMDLKGWQRGVLGLLVFIVALGVVGGLFVAAAFLEII